MRTKIKELKRIARGNLQGHFMVFIRVLVFCNLITSLLELPFTMMTTEDPFATPNIIYYVASILISIAAVVLTAGQYRLHLRLARTGEIHISEVFIPARFHSNQFILTELILFGISLIALLPTFVGIYFILANGDSDAYIFTIIAALISSVLGLLISLTFGLVYFVMLDDENISMLQALKYTKDMVKSHKRRYLYMQLSFIGMHILGILSFGIGYLWIHPYIMQSTTIFYLDVKGELPEVLEYRKKNGPIPEPAAFDSYA